LKLSAARSPSRSFRFPFSIRHARPQRPLYKRAFDRATLDAIPREETVVMPE